GQRVAAVQEQREEAGHLDSVAHALLGDGEDRGHRASAARLPTMPTMTPAPTESSSTAHHARRLAFTIPMKYGRSATPIHANRFTSSSIVCVGPAPSVRAIRAAPAAARAAPHTRASPQ